ncbi:hypothetical protein [Sphingobium sp. ZW T5_29]|jgi:hypothetical protein|uniref:hypothetical protein n=1 Tax=Sphingobium sp. ZW T5_29 TaxID=3378077 RepID=UPI003854F52C
MLAAIPLIMLLAAPQSGDAVGAGRQSFSKCLSDQVQPALDRKMTVSGFQSALKSKCRDKEAAFHAAMVADNRASGMSEKDAQSDADDQVAEYVDKITGEFEDYMR